MSLLARTSPRRQALTAAPAGILANRQQAHPALLRMLSRARRRRAPLLLLRIAPDLEAGPAAAQAHQQFLGHLTAELRISDLAWAEPGGVVLVLLEDTVDGRGPQRGCAARPASARTGMGTPEPHAGAALAGEAAPAGAPSERPAEGIVARLQHYARLAGARPLWRTASFPQQGLTLEALLEEVQWLTR